MSSAILYLAIVAIWAGVLIPRWLRNDAEQERSSAPARPGRVPGHMAAGAAPDMPADAALDDRDPVDELAEEPASPGLTEAERRDRVLSARRNLLCMLLVLAGGAALIAAARLAAWWVVLPPAMMLAGYLLLLREAGKADAERRLAEHTAADRARRARMEAEMAAYERAAARRPEASGQRRAVSWPGAEEPGTAEPEDPAATAEAGPTAEVLDISARMADEPHDIAEEPYDQDAEAELRAVGD